MMDEETRLQTVLSVIAISHGMREVGYPKTAYSRILRETIHFVWELREGTKHSKLRIRSTAGIGLQPRELDYDHAVPMRIIVERLLDAWPDKQAVEHLLRNLVRGVLITKEEHRLLREKGLSSRMPDDWDGSDWQARYEAAGIELSSIETGEEP